MGLTKEIVVNVPAAQVFNFVADPHNAPQYISAIRRITSGPDGTPRIGDSWRADVNFLGRPGSVLLRLTQIDPESLVRITMEGDPRATLTLRLTPRSDNKSTSVSLHLDVPGVPDMLLNALMGGMLGGDLGRLKSVLEAGG